MQVISKSLAQTKNIAMQYAATLKAGDIVLLTGDLGAGKTEFTKGVVNYFCRGAQVTSPTFNIVNQYNCGNQVIYHFDFYRINSPDELVAIGIEEYLYSGAICIIEWPERAPELLQNLQVKNVKINKDRNMRIINF